jgi:phage terminase large subunit-like protein
VPETIRPAPLIHAAASDLPEFIARGAAEGWDWPTIFWRRAAAVPSAWYDAAKADFMVDLWPEIFVLTDLRFAGVPFRLALWQEIAVRLLFGWKLPTEIVDPRTGAKTLAHVRLFRRLLLWIARKNGKSEFLASLALAFWAIDAVYGGQGYCFALNEKQATTVLNKMKAMIAQQPRLARELTVFGKSIWCARKLSRFERLTGKPHGKHGLSPYVSVGDEMHEWISRDLDTTIRQGMAAQLQPIELFASTAGLKTALIGYDLYKESRAILAGPIEPPECGSDTGEGIYDPRSLVIMFGLEEEDDWRDEANWRKVNPNLGLSPTIDFLRGEYAKARNNPRAESHFRRYHLNQWVDASVKWLDVARWDACAEDKKAWKTRAEKLRGRRCFGGLDLSSVKDLTALVWIFPPEEPGGKLEIISKFWCPEDTIELRSREDRLPYDRWARMGALTPTPGDMVDQNYVMRAILEDAEIFDVQMIGYDPMFATKLISDLQEQGFGVERMLKVRQGHLTLAEPTKMLEVEVLAGRFDHGGQPVLRQMAQNAHIRFDRNMNFVPDKQRSAEKIDGIAASCNALTAMLHAAPTSSSFWDTDDA